MRYTPKLIGALIRQTRKHLRVTQKDLALTSGTGLRFVIDLEKGQGDLRDRESTHSLADAGNQTDADSARSVKRGVRHGEETRCLFAQGLRRSPHPE